MAERPDLPGPPRGRAPGRHPSAGIRRAPGGQARARGEWRWLSRASRAVLHSTQRRGARTSQRPARPVMNSRAPSRPDPGRGPPGAVHRRAAAAAVPAAASTRYRAVTPPRRRSALRRARRDRSGRPTIELRILQHRRGPGDGFAVAGVVGNRSVSCFFARSTGLWSTDRAPLLPPSHRHIAERSALTAQVRCAAHASTATTHTGLAACSAHRPANGSGNDELTLAYRCIRLYWWLPIVTGV